MPWKVRLSRTSVHWNKSRSYLKHFSKKTRWRSRRNYGAAINSRKVKPTRGKASQESQISLRNQIKKRKRKKMKKSKQLSQSRSTINLYSKSSKTKKSREDHHKCSNLNLGIYLTSQPRLAETIPVRKGISQRLKLSGPIHLQQSSTIILRRISRPSTVNSKLTKISTRITLHSLH